MDGKPWMLMRMEVLMGPSFRDCVQQSPLSLAMDVIAVLRAFEPAVLMIATEAYAVAEIVQECLMAAS